MVFFHIFLLVLFIIVGVAGLIYRVDEGVFIGLTLAPWEVRIVLAFFGKVNQKLVKMLIIIAGIIGVIYFLLQSRWAWALAMAGVQGYIYLIVTRSVSKLIKKEETDNDKKNKG
ncbi:hypothetical protein BBF96_01250 [Anoxybacter fermentans]|uniref:Uncharacterized protein n=1 Tax=Anoxybacter fermentans TaxID=1323375 RepID=A0A3Q9HNQ1_9FIRM|nr:hypothetical protein [Anoxybacter fermentans]AZR72139.1 hypothetical protein BBF96_01250 [Anoxybacter fermentans]